MSKKLLALLLGLTLCLSLAACGGDSGDSATEDTAGDTTTEDTGDSGETTTTLTVAASPTPHAVILNECVPILAEQGIELVVNQYDDYVVPNTAVEDGDEDANYFQHIPYLDEFNATRGTHLVNVAAVHIEPMGIYAGRVESLEDLPDGAVIGVPNDTSNEYRALALLQEIGLITLDPEAGVTASKLDIIDNPKNLEIVEVEAAQLPRMLADFDLAVINGNYALDAGLSVLTDTVACESSESEGYDERVNYVCVKEGNENAPWVEALRECLSREETKAFIEETYAGSVVLALDAQQQQ